MFDVVLLLLLFAALAPYLVGTILVYFSQQWPARPTVTAYDPIRHSLPDDLAAAFMDSRVALVRSGFQLVGDLAHENAPAKLQLRVALLETADGELAMVVGARSTNPKVKMTACYIEFPTKFADGTTLAVTNTQDPEVYPDVPTRTIERFPEVRDPVRLHRVSQALLERSYGGRERQRFGPGQDPAGFVRDAMVREYENQVRTGYFRLDARTQMYRPSWRGAWAMTWRLLPPLRQIIRARRIRRSKALLADLGLQGSDERPVAAPATSDPMRWYLAIVALLALLYVLVRNSGTQSGGAGDQPLDINLSSDFTVPPDFAGAVRALEALAGDSAEPLMGNDVDGEPRPIPGVSVGVSADRARGIVRAAAEQFRVRGFFLFVAESNFGIQPDRLALFPRADPYELLALMGTNGANYHIDTDSIVAWLRALERDHPFVLEGIAYDWFGGRFTAEIDDADELARRFYAFCPDIVNQGVGSMRALARALRRERTLYCWWD